MPVAITPVATFDAPLTVAGTDAPNSAGMLAVLQTHANRAQYVYERSRTMPSLGFTQIQPGASGMRMGGVHEWAGALVLAGGSTWKAVSQVAPGAVAPSPFSITSAGTLTGTPTVTGFCRAAYGGGAASPQIRFGFEGYSYNFAPDLTDSRAAFAALTVSRDMIWSAYGARWIACGDETTGDGRIEIATAGGAWGVAASASLASGSYGRLAADVTGQYVLATPYVGSTQAYSADGGATWTQVACSLGTVTVRGLCYDDTRGLWLVCSDLAAHTDSIYTATSGLGTWTETAAAIPALGMLGQTVDYASDVIAHGAEWLVAIQGTSSTRNLLRTADQGVTWDGMGPVFSSGSPYLNRAGRYIVAGSTTGAEAVSAPLLI